VISLALDLATDRLTVAAQAPGGAPAERHLAGARRHAGALVPLLAEVLAEVGTDVTAVGRVVLADGPGSFTGLRVAAALAKGLVRAGAASLAVTPSLLGRALVGSGDGPGLVLAAASALRGEVYAGWYRFGAGGEVAVVREAVALDYEAVRAGPCPDRIVGDGPDGFLEALGRHWGAGVVSRDGSLADARRILELDSRPGGTREVADAASWEPTYGRPAEAQARWERDHGRPLPDPPAHPG